MYGPTGQSFERACTMTVALLGAAALRMPVETMGQQRNSGVARPLFPGGFRRARPLRVHRRRPRRCPLVIRSHRRPAPALVLALSCGGDGHCSALPDWNGIAIEESQPVRLRAQERLTFTYDAQGTRRLDLSLLQQPGPRMAGMPDYADGVLTASLRSTCNGRLVLERTVGAQDSFELADIGVAGDQWRPAITPQGFAGAPLDRASLTLGTTVPGRTLLDGTGQGVEWPRQREPVCSPGVVVAQRPAAPAPCASTAAPACSPGTPLRRMWLEDPRSGGAALRVQCLCPAGAARRPFRPGDRDGTATARPRPGSDDARRRGVGPARRGLARSHHP